MDQQTLLILLTIFVAVAAIALLIQMGTMVAMYLAFKKLQGQVTQVFPEVQAILGTTRHTVANVQQHIERIGDTSNSILDTTKVQLVKIDELVTDVTKRAKVQIERAEMVMDDTMGRAQETVGIVQRTVLRPIREIHGVMSGIRTSLAYLGRTGRPTVDHATSDEEMFI
jgi:hypothetical protein